MANREVKFEFQDLRLAGEGLLANGTATLVDAGEGYADEWFVSEVQLDKGPILRRKHSCNTFNAMLFEHIAALIEADSEADAAFHDADDYPAVKIYSATREHGTYQVQNGSVA